MYFFDTPVPFWRFIFNFILTFSGFLQRFRSFKPREARCNALSTQKSET